MLRKLFTLIVCLVAAVATASAQTPPYNEIWYTTTDGRPLFINSGYKKSVGLYMHSDTYNNGRGVLEFKSGGYINFINSGLFDGNDRLKSITIPNIVTSIGEKAFYGCSSLKSITIPNSVTSIGWKAFMGCSSLSSITIPNSVTYIGEGAFKGCSSLKSIIIPNSVTLIRDFAFSGCSSLTSITIPNSVTSIGFCAFSGCSSLTSITIGNSVTSIDSWAFNGCSSLKSVKVANKYCYDYFKDMVADITFYGANASADGRCLIIGGKLERFIAKGGTEYTIPNSVTSIGDRAFWGCSSLTSITIPESVTSIGDRAFWDCSSLTSITIPESVTSIGEGAFAGCDSQTNFGRIAFYDCSILKSVKVANWYCYDYFKDEVDDIAFYGANASDDGRCLIIDGELKIFIAKGVTEYTITESVTEIGSGAFRGCSSLKSITIPNSVTWIGGRAFNGCSSLTSITCLATTPPAIDDLRIGETTLIYVPKEAVKAYKKDPKWVRYKKQIKPHIEAK